MKYKELMMKSQEQLEVEALNYMVEDNKLQLELDLKATSRSLTEGQRNLVALKSKEILDTKAILDQIEDIEAMERAIEVIKALIKELF